MSLNAYWCCSYTIALGEEERSYIYVTLNLVCFHPHLFFLPGPEISWQMSSRLPQSESPACDQNPLDSQGKKKRSATTWGGQYNSANRRMLFVVLRDSPVVQGNSILALSGLAAVLAKYESNLPADGDGSLGVTHSIFKPITVWFAIQDFCHCKNSTVIALVHLFLKLHVFVSYL